MFEEKEAWIVIMLHVILNPTYLSGNAMHFQINAMFSNI